MSRLARAPARASRVAAVQRARRTRVASSSSSSSFGDADVLRWARRAWCERVRADGDVVVDATLGRGRDALYLALECASPDVLIRGFDVASEALEASTRAFEDARVSPRRFAFEQRCHADALEAMAATRARDVGVLMANLGYLPAPGLSADERARRTRTQASTSARLVRAGTRTLRLGGVCTVVAYLGHDGGAEENEAVRRAFAELSPKEFTVVAHAVVNRANAPVLYVCERVR
jgi:hypothetical protein